MEKIEVRTVPNNWDGAFCEIVNGFQPASISLKDVCLSVDQREYTDEINGKIEEIPR